MSKHNYTQYSNKPKVTVSEDHPDPVGAPCPMGVDGKPKVINDTVETNTVEGTVTGCAKLNVRSDASLFADVVCTLDVMSEIMIDINKSTKDWLYICTATGIEGYCMRKFVDTHL